MIKLLIHLSAMKEEPDLFQRVRFFAVLPPVRRAVFCCSAAGLGAV
ncbi:hypothetical protein [Streptomyces sp. NRRL S-1448]|nr:hypothetical protein [Streptomyces sp. NRRL S-1448]